MLEYVDVLILLVLDWYLSDSSQNNWKTINKVLRHLQSNKNLILTHRHINIIEVIGLSDSYYVGCVDDKKSTFDYIFMMIEGTISWKSVNRHLQLLLPYGGREYDML